MKQSLYITATGPQSGKNAIALGAMHFAGRAMGKVAIFRPIIPAPRPGERNPAIETMLSYFKLDQPYETTFAFTEDQAYRLISVDSSKALVEAVLAKYKALEAEYDFVLCVGSDFLGRDPVFEFNLNSEIAGNLDAPVILVLGARGMSLPEVRQNLQSAMSDMAESCELAGIVINSSSLTRAEIDALCTGFASPSGKPALIYAIPDDPEFSNPSIHDVANAVDAEFLNGGSLDALVSDFVIAAMHPDHFLSYIAKDLLVITPGDRSDILLATLVARLSPTMPPIAGVLLTGGIRPSEPIMQLIRSMGAGGLPIMITDHHTYRASQLVQNVHAALHPGDVRKINTALGLFDHYVDGSALIARGDAPARMTPLMFEFNLLASARRKKQRIVLCEGEEPRILQATDILLRREAVDVILLGNRDRILTQAKKLGLHIEGATIIDPAASPEREDYAESYYEFRKAKGMTEERARDVMLDATYYGTMMVKKGHADGMVSGSINTTAHTIRPAFEFIKTKPGFSVVSSVFLMCMRDRVLVFGDCAVNPNPTAAQLAEIAITSAQTAKVFGIEPRVAMLSYSTGASGKGADVDVVVEATRIAKEKAPDILLEGPLQYDAAIDPTVAKTKAPDSPVAGKATVFIFPDLNTGNNTYKAVQRAAGAVAIGPVLQGLKKPVNDLSRGCLVADIVNTVIITAIQAAAENESA